MHLKTSYQVQFQISWDFIRFILFQFFFHLTFSYILLNFMKLHFSFTFYVKFLRSNLSTFSNYYIYHFKHYLISLHILLLSHFLVQFMQLNFLFLFHKHQPFLQVFCFPFLNKYFFLANYFWIYHNYIILIIILNVLLSSAVTPISSLKFHLKFFLFLEQTSSTHLKFFQILFPNL